ADRGGRADRGAAGRADDDPIPRRGPASLSGLKNYLKQLVPGTRRLALAPGHSPPQRQAHSCWNGRTAEEEAMTIRRRQVLAGSGLALGSSVLGLPLLAGETPPGRRRKIIAAGGHPDDPESTAGGTMALFADGGHEVVALYLTRGEAGIKGKN